MEMQRFIGDKANKMSDKKGINSLELLHAIREIPSASITYLEKALLCTLLSCMNSKNECWYSVQSIADFASCSFKTATRTIKNLEQKKFIFVTKPAYYHTNVTNRYCLNINLIMQYHINKVVPYQSTTQESATLIDHRVVPPQSTKCYPISPTKKKERRKEEERAGKSARSALSPDWYPNQKTEIQCQEVSKKCGKTFDQLLSRFKNLQILKESTSINWDLEFENFLINEKIPEVLSMKPAYTNGHSTPTNSYGSMRDFTQERLDREAEEDRAKKNH